MARILIAVEDREFAEVIDEFFTQHSYSEDTEVKVLHVIEIAEAVNAWPSEQYRKDAEELVTSLTQGLQRRFPGLKVEGVIMEGCAKELIVDVAQQWHADLILVGAHAKPALAKLFLGSVSSAVASHAPCSVVVVRPASQAKKDRTVSRFDKNSCANL